MSADDDLIRRAKGGDAGAWRELYAAHAGRLVVWLRTLPSGDVVTAPEDLAADAWLTAAQKISTFDGSGTEFAGWLFGIARLQAANARRRSLRRATTPGSLEGRLEGTSADMEDGVAGDHWIRAVLAGLPTREREVLACIDVVGLDVASTAAALGMSRTAVRVARHRGLSRLRRAGVSPD